MPAFYAHYRFGCDVMNILPPEARTLCENQRPLFDIGLHGPDIFFFHRPLIPNAVSKYGHRCHGQPGRDFLIRAKEVISDSADKDASLAYFYGFLCHLALDSSCHPGVYKAQTYTGAGHTAIETALDYMLLTRDGIVPLQHDPCGHFEISTENAEIIAQFFPPVDASAVEKSLRTMITYGRILYIKDPIVRKALDLALYITGHHESFAGMLMTENADPRCTESSKRLFELYEDALPLAAKLIEKTPIYIENKMPVDKVFDRTFKGPLEK